jgi:hypothetical protein
MSSADAKISPVVGDVKKEEDETKPVEKKQSKRSCTKRKGQRKSVLEQTLELKPANMQEALHPHVSKRRRVIEFLLFCSRRRKTLYK